MKKVISGLASIAIIISVITSVAGAADVDVESNFESYIENNPYID